MNIEDEVKQRKSTYVVVRATLASRENSVVDTFLEVALRGVLPEENQTSTGATKRLVTKRQ